MAMINVMPKHLAELIAAGEVVERPASIVKELLENSIDAGADTITLEIKNGGISYIRITDNGSGILREDVATAFLSHATSKIKTSDDLNNILTLGFRGEALPSIAAVSEVEVLTCAEGEKIGTRYLIEYGEQVLVDDAGCPAGTTITVRNLFKKTPARMKFLKKDVTEANAVSAVVDRTALSHPEISFRFIREGKQTLMTSGKGDLQTCIREVFGRDFAQGLIPCQSEGGTASVKGFISKPEYSRPNRNMQYFFINGRYIRTGTGSAALSEAYKNSIMVGKFPSCVLFITVDPSNVDINVHPAKTEVRFGDEKSVFNAVYSACKNALSEGDTPHQMHHTEKTKPFTFPKDYRAEPVKPADQIRLTEKNSNFWQHIDVRNEPVTPHNDTIKTTFTASAPKNALDEDDESIDTTENILLNSPGEKTDIIPPVKTDEVPLPDETDEFNSEDFRLIGEAFLTYILCEYKKKIVVIDKHAAHERIIYEKLKKENGERYGQALLSPLSVNLQKDEYSAVTENIDIINEAGFEIEDFGDGCVLVRRMPMELTVDDIPSVLAEIAGGFVDKKQSVSFEKLDWIYHSVACRSAVKAGNINSAYELEKFAKQVLEMPDIRYCPHGRPVLIEITRRELEKNFGRT